MRNITMDRINELKARIIDDRNILITGNTPLGIALPEESREVIERAVVNNRTELVRLVKSLHPKVGMGATMRGWSDSHAGTIIWVAPSGKRIKVQRDRAELLNGPDSGEPDALQVHPGGFCAHVEGRQRYAYSPNTTGTVIAFSLRKNGRWVRVGESTNGYSCTPGIRAEHYDYNF